MYEIIESNEFAVPKRDSRADLADKFRNDRNRIKSQDQIFLDWAKTAAGNLYRTIYFKFIVKS